VGFDDWFRLSAHAVITDAHDRVLLLRAAYGDQAWGLPGGALDPGETIHDALQRECAEELGTRIVVEYLSGVYAHPAVRSHAFIFRCSLPDGAELVLSDEHTEARYFDPHELADVQRRRVLECIHFDGAVRSARF
jgi:8-oxo-dGTP diphosphatase